MDLLERGPNSSKRFCDRSDRIGFLGRSEAENLPLALVWIEFLLFHVLNINLPGVSMTLKKWVISTWSLLLTLKKGLVSDKNNGVIDRFSKGHGDYKSADCIQIRGDP